MENQGRTPFGQRLRNAREHAKLTQKQAAKAVGMSQGTLAEAETAGVGSGYTAQLAKLYGVDPVWLSTGRGSSEQVAAAVVDPVLDDLAALLPEDAAVWRAQIRAAAIKARRGTGRLPHEYETGYTLPPPVMPNHLPVSQPGAKKRK